MQILDEFRWKPEIGDPTFMGWFTVVAYAVAALLAVRVWYRQRDCALVARRTRSWRRFA